MGPAASNDSYLAMLQSVCFSASDVALLRSAQDSKDSQHETEQGNFLENKSSESEAAHLSKWCVLNEPRCPTDGRSQFIRDKLYGK